MPSVRHRARHPEVGRRRGGEVGDRRGSRLTLKTTIVAATDEEMLNEFPRRARATDWFLRIREIAPGGYVVAARDRWGRQVTHTCPEAELSRTIEDVERYAERVAASSDPARPLK
jgi:hypothetical protein